jgi:hypothetical protein
LKKKNGIGIHATARNAMTEDAQLMPRFSYMTLKHLSGTSYKKLKEATYGVNNGKTAPKIERNWSRVEWWFWRNATLKLTTVFAARTLAA